jgi:hypothetical protein
MTLGDVMSEPEKIAELRAIAKIHLIHPRSDLLLNFDSQRTQSEAAAADK